MCNLETKIFEGDTFLTNDFTYDGTVLVTGNLYVDGAIKVRNLVVYGTTLINSPTKDIEAARMILGGDAFIIVRSFNVPYLVVLSSFELTIKDDKAPSTSSSKDEITTNGNPYCDCCNDCPRECCEECPCIECDLSEECNCEYCPDTCPYEECPLGDFPCGICSSKVCPCHNCPEVDCNCSHCPETCPLDDNCSREGYDDDCDEYLCCDEDCSDGCENCRKCQPSEE